MHYIGIDLAWGLNRPTGLAVLDASARLIHASAVRTDDEISETLTSYVEGPCLVGIDAPLIVVNATGSRPAEQALTKDFRRFEAGTHPSNTGKPEFAEGTRGERVCTLLGLDLDPDSTAERRALEVYPHPATIVLFDLDRTLKYKQKQGRDLELLRRELLRLMDHTARLVDIGGPDDRWAAMRAAVVAATRKSELRVVEDQVDAVVCAYVALFADRWPDRITRYGDLATGYIVTPALGVGRGDVVESASAEYAAHYPEREQAGRAGGQVLELGCGTGHKLIPIASDGYACVGLDLSSDMLTEARRKADECDVVVEWVQGDMTDFDLGRAFDLVLIAGNSLLHLHEADDLVSCFRSVRRHLAPGGRLVFDVFNPSVRMLAEADGARRTRESMSFSDPERGRVSVDVSETYDARTQVTRGTWHLSTDSEADYVVAPLRIRSIFPQELPLLLALAGLRLVERFGDWSGGPFSADAPLQLCVCESA